MLFMSISRPMYGDNSSGLCLPCPEECLSSCSGPVSNSIIHICSPLPGGYLL